jgi:hypothetical protein
MSEREECRECPFRTFFESEMKKRSNLAETSTGKTLSRDVLHQETWVFEKKDTVPMDADLPSQIIEQLRSSGVDSRHLEVFSKWLRGDRQHKIAKAMRKEYLSEGGAGMSQGLVSRWVQSIQRASQDALEKCLGDEVWFSWKWDPQSGYFRKGNGSMYVVAEYSKKIKLDISVLPRSFLEESGDKVLSVFKIRAGTVDVFFVERST